MDIYTLMHTHICKNKRI